MGVKYQLTKLLNVASFMAALATGAYLTLR